MSTTENLQAAFAGESQANRKYLAFARKADEEGFPQIARLFRATAEAETVHAHSHLRVLKGVGGTAENLQQAIAGEQHEFQEMYPAFLAEAEREKQSPAVTTFKYALEVEQTHHQLFTQAAESLKGGKDLPAAKVYVCSVCGHTVVGEAPHKCPVCKVGRERFQEIG